MYTTVQIYTSEKTDSFSCQLLNLQVATCKSDEVGGFLNFELWSNLKNVRSPKMYMCLAHRYALLTN